MGICLKKSMKNLISVSFKEIKRIFQRYIWYVDFEMRLKIVYLKIEWNYRLINVIRNK